MHSTALLVFCDETCRRRWHRCRDILVNLVGLLFVMRVVGVVSEVIVDKSYRF